jgi:molecular chaperone HscA
MPNIKNFVKIFFNKEPLSNINPDNVVAVGASIQANIMSGNSSEELLLLDVIPLSLGIETMGELVEVIIPRNSTIPTSSSKEYTTFKDGQSAMSIHVVQGERDIVSDCRSLAKFTVNDIPPMLAGAARVRLEFQIDANGILSINATETTTGKVTSVEVKPSYGITDSDIEKMLKDSIDNAEEDIKNRHLKEAAVEGNRVILAIKSALDIDGSELLSEEEQNEISHAIGNLEKKLKGSNKDNIINAIKSLENVCETYVERRMNSNIQKIMKGTDIKEYN